MPPGVHKFVGWRVWLDDGAILSSKDHDWQDVPDKILVKMLYYDGGGKQVQASDWYLEIPHSKGTIRRTCTDAKKPDLVKEYPDAVFREGFWTVDDWFSEIHAAAMASTWADLKPEAVES